jgi:hypothetical protein
LITASGTSPRPASINRASAWRIALTMVPNVHVKVPVENEPTIAPFTSGSVSAVAGAGEHAPAKSTVHGPGTAVAPSVTLSNELTIEPGRFERVIPASLKPTDPLIKIALALPADKPRATMPVATIDLRVLFILASSLRYTIEVDR